jgi:hypothetical protein
MPSKSKAQRNFMAAVAHNPTFAKKAGVPQSVGKEFNEADKGHKFKTGGPMATKKMAGGGDTIGKSGNKQSKGITAEKMAAVRTAAPSRDGLAEKGRTKGKVPTMAGGKVLGTKIGAGNGMKKGGKVK